MSSIHDTMFMHEDPASGSGPSSSFSGHTPLSAGHNGTVFNPGYSVNQSKRPKSEEDDDKDTSDADRKKTKFTRSRTACLQCRSRKSKCGALPPAPCPNCIEANLPCQWPAEDGRSSKARLQRAKARLSSTGEPMTGNGPGQPMYGNEVKVEGLHGEFPENEPNWLDQLLNGSRNVVQEPAPYTGPPYSSGLPPQHISEPSIPGPSTGMFPPPQIPAPMQQQPNFFPNMSNPTFPQSMDPAQFIWAVSSRLPTVEESSPFENSSNHSNPSPSYDPNKPKRKNKNSSEAGKIVKVTWWRPHGQTAIAPGLKRITLKVRVDSPQDPWRNYSPRPPIPGSSDVPQDIMASDGAPTTPIMRHLLDVFMVHFGCQYPFIERAGLEQKIESRTGSVFLLNSIAAIAARFSTHPAIALPELQPYDYGNVFYNRAKAMLGSMLAVPSRETVASFALLASCGFANDSESEVWMMTGLAVRMSIDLGLHLDPPESSNISSGECRLNRLVFWSVLLMDYALAFGVGRSTTYRVDEITQPVPTQEDVDPDRTSDVRSPFPFCAQMMISYGPLINMLNQQDTGKVEGAIAAARSASIKEYNQLPADMQWNVGNLQKHSRVNQASAFLHLHLWMHTILASGYLTAGSILRRGHVHPTGTKSGAATPNSATASNLWRNSARTIGDILVLSDIINPLSYCALPFVNQAFFVAGCCYVKEIEQTQSTVPSPANSPRRVPASLGMTSARPDNNGHQTTTADGKPVDLSRALLTSVATTNIATLQQGLAKQNTYWQGTAWISSALAQRIEGMEEVDLVGVTEKLGSSVSLPDAGLVGRKNMGEEDQPEGANELGQGVTPGMDWMTFTPGVFGSGVDMDFLSSLPFDMGTMDSAQNVIEQDVPLQSFDSQWFK